jgi:hypothetical protein
MWLRNRMMAPLTELSILGIRADARIAFVATRMA